MTYRAPYETAEWVYVEVSYKDPVTKEKTIITTGVEFSRVAQGARPGTFTPAVIQGGRTGINVSGLPAGIYDVWSRTNGSVVDFPARLQMA